MELVLISVGIVLAFMFLGMPIALCFLSGSLFYMIVGGESMGSVAPEAFFALDKYALLAIPLFMIAGTLMEVSGIAEKLIDFANALLKKVKGGMGAIIPVSSMFFGALSGSGTATVAALSTILVPKLERLGWDKRYTAALLGASGPLGYMIPPNMNAILFGVIANASVAALFLATVIPGIIWGVLYIIINRLTYKKWYKPNKQIIAEDVAPTTNVTYFQGVSSTFVAAIPAFIMPAIIFGGIYGGVFTPTEAGAVACAYALIAGVFIFKGIKRGNFLSAFTHTGGTLGSIMIILPMVVIFTNILVINGVPQMIAEGLNSVSSNKYVVLLLIDILLVVAGFFLDAGVLIFVVAPLLIPTAEALGINIIQLGVIIFVAIGVGTVTPPMAMNLFITSKVSGVSLKDMMKPLLPFLVFAAIPVLLLVTFVPELSLWLPRVIMDIKL
ncbi:TRAP transporter large permease [Bacillus sp. Marseille-P3661]|uniref:TRAP transporter large permease n=1 Tax=Bacillus sp. Marseille-P3661 TaxID=1936234 RepID=UPI000C84703E|nr:TRAP transporter large permease [Bacillus sp. Marseille-P3661]